VIRRRGPWRSLEAVEFATLEWVDWFNNRRLLEPIGGIPPAEAAEAPQTSTDTATKVAPKSAEKAQHLVDQTARTAQSAVQQAGQKNLDLALQLTGTAVSSYQSVQSELAEHAQQAVQRTLDALTQASQVRSPTALLDLQSTYRRTACRPCWRPTPGSRRSWRTLPSRRPTSCSATPRNKHRQTRASAGTMPADPVVQAIGRMPSGLFHFP
jgi:hypothetical protein